MSGGENLPWEHSETRKKKKLSSLRFLWLEQNMKKNLYFLMQMLYSEGKMINQKKMYMVFMKFYLVYLYLNFL